MSARPDPGGGQVVSSGLDLAGLGDLLARPALMSPDFQARVCDTAVRAPAR
jgi:hypothetical protein